MPAGRVGGPVKYIDPFNCAKDDMDVLFGKHLKYWYQSEYPLRLDT
jgi:hypothetical protein